MELEFKLKWKYDGYERAASRSAILSWRANSSTVSLNSAPCRTKGLAVSTTLVCIKWLYPTRVSLPESAFDFVISFMSDRVSRPVPRKPERLPLTDPRYSWTFPVPISFPIARTSFFFASTLSSRTNLIIELCTRMRLKFEYHPNVPCNSRHSSFSRICVDLYEWKMNISMKILVRMIKV